MKDNTREPVKPSKEVEVEISLENKKLTVISIGAAFKKD